MSEIETTTADPESDEQDLLPGTSDEREREREYGMSVIAPDELPMLPGEVRPHPSPFQYVMIAVVLCVVTALEVGMYYLERDTSVPKWIITATLLVMAFVKFVIVAAWYMHLRTDRKIFRRFFIVGGTAAIILYLIVFVTLAAITPNF